MALEHVDQLAGSENFERTIATFDRNFTRLLKDLLVSILNLSSEAGGYNKLINLVYRSVMRNHVRRPNTNTIFLPFDVILSVHIPYSLV